MMILKIIIGCEIEVYNIYEAKYMFCIFLC